MVSPPGTGSPIEIIAVEFPAGATVAFDRSRLAAADQHVWVLEGAMALTVGGERYDLGVGDCLHMTLDRPISFHNLSGRAAR